MANLFRPSSNVNAPAPPVTSLRIQQSVQGKGRLVGWGQTRIAGNLVWYGDFTSRTVSDGGGGGKGGGGGGGKGGGGGSKTLYSAAVAISMCEGPIDDVFTIWYNKQKTTYQIAQDPFSEVWGAPGQSLNLTLFKGTYYQSPWGYLTSLHPGQDLSYRGDAYMAAGPLQLGESPELPNFTFMVNFNLLGGNDISTKSLLHLNGETGSTFFPDSAVGSSSAHVWTANGTAAVTTLQAKFGGSLALDGVAAWISTPASVDFQFGSGNGAVDFWFNCTAAGGARKNLCGQGDVAETPALSSFRIIRTAANVIDAAVFVGGATVQVTGTTQFTNALNTGWNNCTMVIESGFLKLFINGVQEGGSVAIGGAINSSAFKLSVGQCGEVTTNPWLGNVDEFRFSSVARSLSQFAFFTREWHTREGAAYSGTVDANPRGIVFDALVNDKYGVGFPPLRWEGSDSYAQYCGATGLVMSPTISDQKAFSDHLRDWLMGTNSEAVWSAGQLKIIPYGDQSATANGYAYTVPALPLYALTDADLMAGGGDTGAPVDVHRTRVEDQANSVSIEFLDYNNDYNPAVVEVKDDAAIQVYGLKKRTVTQLHQFTQISAAIMSASLMLGRELIRCQYTFTAQGSFILLDPMDVITVTDSGLSSSAITVRIKEITENEDHSLTMIAEDYLAGSASSPLYGAQPGQGANPDYNATPGVVATPLIFEPTDELAHGLFIWGAVTGSSLTNWGGCEVWASWDGITYAKVQENLIGGARFGVLSATLPTFVAPVQGAALDNTNTLSVDLTLSQGQLASGSATDNLLFGSMLWVDGELISYQTAVVTGTYSYNLTGLNRGALGTDISAHASGSSFTRVDQGIFSVPYTQDKIGATLYLKFLSFNRYGANKQGLQDVGAFTYKILGTALTSPLPNVENFVSSFVGNITYLDWDTVDDFRNPIQYEIRKGTNWETSQFVGTFSHPHIPAIGDADYWIKAVVTPIAGLTVYSEDAVALNISGSVVPFNLLARYDEGPSGAAWPGTLDGDVVNDGIFIRTIFSDPATFGTDFLAIANVFDIVDKFFVGGGAGYYTIPNTHIVNCGRLAPCLVSIDFAGIGEGSSDFFHPGPPDDNDFFAHDDVFDTEANRFIDVHPEIAISTDGVTFGPWQRYQAGVYNLWKVKARMLIRSIDPVNVVAVLTQFIFTVYAPTRTDHPLVNFALPPAGQTVTFAPDGGLPAAAFNGGPNGGEIAPSPGVTLPNPAALPGVQVSNLSLVAGDDIFITGLSLSQLTIQAKNAGVGVTRNVVLQVWGF